MGMTEHPVHDRLLIALIAIVVVLAIGIPMAILMTAGPMDSWMDSHFGMMGEWGGAWVLMMIVPIVVVIVLVFVLVYALREDRTLPPPTYAPIAPPSGDARAILDRRLASGEISIDEYNRIMEQLTGRR